ncbi:MAG: bifunctional metallophosphatase/5'-nucleotidase [Kangiellaceae bacterium]
MMYLKITRQNIVISLIALIFSYASDATEKATLIFAGEMTEIASEKKGGYPELATLLKQYRKSDNPTFFLFGGGSLGPSTLSSLDRGTHIIDLLNSLEPDAMGVAKREFSFLEDELSLRSYEAAFPLVASNLEDQFTHENLDGLVNSIIVQQGQIRLGVLSILDESVIDQYGVSRIKIINQRLAVEKRAKELLEQGAELIILLYSHLDPNIIHLLNEHTIDISLMRDEHLPQENISTQSKHPHDFLLNEFRKVAVLDLQWIKGDRRSLKVKRKTESLNDFAKDSAVLEQVRNYTSRLSTLLDQPIGTLKTSMDTNLEAVRSRENKFGNFVADTMRNFAGADVAVINGGTIRGEKKYVANSKISRSDIIKELPFRNKISVIEVTGKQIINALENGLSLIETFKGRFLQISGMQVKYDSSQNVGSRIISIMIGDKALEPTQKYKLATTSYISVGGDSFVMFKNLKPIKYNNQIDRLLSDVVIDAIKQNPIISLKLDSRLVDLNNTNK